MYIRWPSYLLRGASIIQFKHLILSFWLFFLLSLISVPYSSWWSSDGTAVHTISAKNLFPLSLFPYSDNSSTLAASILSALIGPFVPSLQIYCIFLSLLNNIVNNIPLITGWRCAIHSSWFAYRLASQSSQRHVYTCISISIWCCHYQCLEVVIR